MKVLPLYLPHQGCAHQCVYCNQPLVVGPGEDFAAWRARLDSLPGHSCKEWEIAFFGGTFSALEPANMRAHFQAIAPYTKQAHVLGVRISTRPDRVSQETLQFLKSAGVRTIELGVESLDEKVLRKSARGHTVNDVTDACRRIRQEGFQLGIHLMCGLPGQSADSFYQTVDEAVSLQPHLARIAPTLVLKGTPLEKLYLRGDYEPQPLEEAIRQCAYACRIFHRHGITIARVGLAVSDTEGDGIDKIVAGPWHPALRHEVESRIVYETIRSLLIHHKNDTKIFIHPKDLSIAMGEGKKNLLRWRNELGRSVEIVRDENQSRHTVRLDSGTTRSLFDFPVEETE